MAKPTDLSRLKYAHDVRPGVCPLKRPIEVFGFDCETDSDGRITVLASSDRSYCFGEPLDDVVDFLTDDRFRFSCNFFFNLGFDHNAIFKSILSEDELMLLCSLWRVTHGRYSFDCIKGKMLKIVKNGKVWRFFDIANFYRGGSSNSLVNVYRDTFGREYKKRLDASASFDSVDDETVLYCIEDAIACRELADNLVIPTNKIVPMNKFYSGASLAKKLLQNNLSHIYRFRPSRLAQFAMNAYGGARIEVFQRGGWGFKDNEKLYMYDIRSAYPSVQCGLDEIICNKTSRRYEYEPDALHSFFHISVDIGDCLVGPLKYRFKNVIFYPVGKQADLWVDKNEIELLMEYGMNFRILEAEHDLSPPAEKPYAYLRKLYDERLKYKKSKIPEERQLDFPLKTALASTYGILIERNAKHVIKDKFEDVDVLDEDATTFSGKDGIIKAVVPEWKAGSFFNPVHACEVTSAIRCKLYRDSEPYQNHLIKFATDCMTFDKRIPLDFGDALGQYEDSPAYNQAIVIGCGVYSMVSEGKKINKFRSFDSHDLIGLAAENGEKSMVEIVKKAPIKLKESRLERFIWFNTFQEKHKRLDINFDHRRRWQPMKLGSFNELMSRSYTSRPIDFSHFTGI